MIVRSFLIGAIVAFGALPSTAQEVVGRALVDGKMVEIMSDRTWRFEGEDSAQAVTGSTANTADCTAIHARVSFCIDPNVWTPSPPASSEITAAYRHDDRHYGQFVIEDFGSRDGMTAELMRDFVVRGASARTGQAREEIVILGVEESSLDGMQTETVIYLVELDGFNFVFSNTILVQDAFTMQAITFAIGASYTDQHQGLHTELLSNTRLN